MSKFLQDTKALKKARQIVDDSIVQPTEKSLPPVTFKCASEIEIKPFNWLWHGYLPAGMLCLLGGAPGCGKTTIALSLAAIVSSAGSWPDGRPCRNAGDVLIWTGEDIESVIAARLKASGANLRKVHFISGTNGQAFDPASDFSLLAESLGNIRPTLLIIDPIVSAVSKDAHRSNDVRRGLQPIVDIAEQLDCAVLGITHFSKGTSGNDPTERITGSVAFAALARVVLVAAKCRPDESTDSEPAKEKRVLLRAKSNIGPDDGGFEYSLERIEIVPGVEAQATIWGNEVQGSAREILKEAEGQNRDPDVGHEDDDQSSEIENFIKEVLKEGACFVSDIKEQARNAGFSFRTIQHHRNRLGITTKKLGMSGGWQWVLPEDATETAKMPKIHTTQSACTFGTFGENLAPSGTGEPASEPPMPTEMTF